MENTGLALSSLILEAALSRLRMSCSTPNLFSTRDGASKCRRPSPLVSVYLVGSNGCAVSSLFVDVAFDTTFEQIEELRSRMLRNGETFWPCSTLRLIVSVFHFNQKCDVSNALQASRTNRSSRLRQILSTRAIGNKALSKVQSILFCG